MGASPTHPRKIQHTNDMISFPSSLICNCSVHIGHNKLVRSRQTQMQAFHCIFNLDFPVCHCVHCGAPHSFSLIVISTFVIFRITNYYFFRLSAVPFNSIAWLHRYIAVPKPMPFSPTAGNPRLFCVWTNGTVFRFFFSFSSSSLPLQIIQTTFNIAIAET